MSRQIALKTLIKYSLLLSESDKKTLLDKVPSLSDEQIDELGRFLALEQKTISKNMGQIESNINLVADLLSEEAEKRKGL